MNDANRNLFPAQAPDFQRSGSRLGRKIEMLSDRIDSRDLFVGTREIIIRHGDEAYRLRLTARNKLILTK